MKKTIHSYIKKAKKSYSEQKLQLAQFIDDFSKTKDRSLISKPVKKTDPISQLFIATAHQLCINNGISVPKWMYDYKELKNPYFVSPNREFNLLSLRDSPFAFRIRNIFVTKNFLERY